MTPKQEIKYEAYKMAVEAYKKRKYSQTRNTTLEIFMETKDLLKTQASKESTSMKELIHRLINKHIKDYERITKEAVRK